MTNCKISPAAFGLAIGIVWGVSVFITGMLAFYFTYGMPFVVAMSNIYVGYEASLIGSLVGGAFGFVDGFIGGAIVAWLYNCFAEKCCCSVEHKAVHPKPKAVKKTKKRKTIRKKK